MELLRMPGGYADATKEAKAHGSFWHCMVTWRPADAKTGWSGLVCTAVFYHCIYECHCCTSGLQAVCL